MALVLFSFIVSFQMFSDIRVVYDDGDLKSYIKLIQALFQ